MPCPCVKIATQQVREDSKALDCHHLAITTRLGHINQDAKFAKLCENQNKSTNYDLRSSEYNKVGLCWFLTILNVALCTC